MKYILADAYRIIYKIIKNKMVATAIAVLITSYFSFLMIHAICLLVDDLDLIPTFILTFPFSSTAISFAFYIVIYLVWLWNMPSQYMMAKEKDRSIRYAVMIVYTLSAIISYIYIQYLVDFNF